MKKIIISAEMPENMADKLRELFPYEIKTCEKNSFFDDAVACHPDMNFFQIGNNLFTFFDVQNNENVNIHINDAGKLEYPNDVFLNAVCIGEDLICRTSSVYKKALDHANSIGMNIINVNQGYVKCNIAVVNEENRAVITEDKGIYKILLKNGYDVLLLETHSVELKPYEFGFIGGATGNINGKLIFTGNVEKHPEYERIVSFCNKHQTECISLSGDKLYDYGSILLIDTDREVQD